jgi:hypothetical protein
MYLILLEASKILNSIICISLKAVTGFAGLYQEIRAGLLFFCTGQQL